MQRQGAVWKVRNISILGGALKDGAAPQRNLGLSPQQLVTPASKNDGGELHQCFDTQFRETDAGVHPELRAIRERELVPNWPIPYDACARCAAAQTDPRTSRLRGGTGDGNAHALKSLVEGGADFNKKATRLHVGPRKIPNLLRCPLPGREFGRKTHSLGLRMSRGAWKQRKFKGREKDLMVRGGVLRVRMRSRATWNPERLANHTKQISPSALPCVLLRIIVTTWRVNRGISKHMKAKGEGMEKRQSDSPAARQQTKQMSSIGKEVCEPEIRDEGITETKSGITPAHFLYTAPRAANKACPHATSPIASCVVMAPYRV